LGGSSGSSRILNKRQCCFHPLDPPNPRSKIWATQKCIERRSRNVKASKLNKTRRTVVTHRVKKILIVGSSGAGKSILSRRLGEVTGLPVIHLDKYHWRPGWTEPSKEVWREQVAELVQRDEWIMDGNFGGTMEQRLAGCDTVVFLDLPRHVCTWRVLKRVITYRGDTRPDLAEGCPEKLDIPFLIWVWNFPKRSRPTVLERIAKVKDRVRVFRLTNNAEIENFLSEMQHHFQANRSATGVGHSA
jgi:adenylate kinase family enzyme